ncbi:hypothetical protein EIP91_003435 [Steccherinum ochraceum]|uniref:DUF6534 domain-containing protein n=1 Tax=Steccherinum ochraceum TaxID=92696 RepID=A0A4R0RM80_9APHY|nr:hypothetical protein EIP91_003435 [Steccherinum ochraceum]
MDVIRPSLGSVLLGTIVGAFLSGIVTMQVYLYFRIYRNDRATFKYTVALIWALDLLHTAMASAAVWVYLIENFGGDISDHITWTIAVTITLTAMITFFVHIFFVHRIFALSNQNYYITLPIFIFTGGLTSAAVVDIMITTALIFYLKRSRTGFSGMDVIINSITLYTVETGLITSVTTVASLICWISMPHNLIFLGLHFAISKLYANALLATLNARKTLGERSQASSGRNDHHMPVLFPDSSLSSMSRSRPRTNHLDSHTSKLEINVEKTVVYDGGLGHPVTNEILYPPSGPSNDCETGIKLSPLASA